MEQKVVVSGIYTHFKNPYKLYRVIGEAIHTETDEKMVIYQEVGGEQKIFARPFDSFVSLVPDGKGEENKNAQKFRFELVEPKVIVDIGTHGIKSYLVSGFLKEDFYARSILLKKDFDPQKGLSEKNEEAFFLAMDELKEEARGKALFVFATSVFRKMNDEVRNAFADKFEKRYQTKFNVISQEEEARYMLLGVETSIQTKERILVCNIGGGSTEMKVYEQGKIIEEVNTEVGCTDITNRFPDLYDELVKTPISEIKEYIKEHLNYPKTRCKYALFTGGHITYTKAAKYHLQQNDCFAEINVPYYIHAIEYNKNSQDTFYRTKLSDLKKTKPDNPDWFNGSRAVATMVETIFDQLNIDVMFPTDMNMIDGIMVDLYK